jgi:hypothetical protein
MARQTIIETPFVTMWYHPEKGVVHHQIHKFIAGPPFRELLLTGSDLIRKHQARKWLSDDRENSALRQDDFEWSETEWAPLTAKAGWRYWAIVQPGKVLGQVAMQRLKDKYGKLGVTTQLFTDPIAAMNWLETQP